MTAASSFGRHQKTGQVIGTQVALNKPLSTRPLVSGLRHCNEPGAGSHGRNYTQQMLTAVVSVGIPVREAHGYTSAQFMFLPAQSPCRFQAVAAILSADERVDCKSPIAEFRSVLDVQLRPHADSMVLHRVFRVPPPGTGSSLSDWTTWMASVDTELHGRGCAFDLDGKGLAGDEDAAGPWERSDAASSSCTIEPANAMETSHDMQQIPPPARETSLASRVCIASRGGGLTGPGCPEQVWMKEYWSLSRTRHRDQRLRARLLGTNEREPWLVSRQGNGSMSILTQCQSSAHVACLFSLLPSAAFFFFLFFWSNARDENNRGLAELSY